MSGLLNCGDAGSLIDLSVEEQIHREVYIAILNSALREVGSKADLARRLGVSPAYLSFLLHDDPRTSDSFRRPSLRIADAISRALPIEHEVRVALREHMQQAHIARIQRQRVLAEDASLGAVTSRVAALRRLHSEATFAPAAPPELAERIRYRAVLDASHELLRSLLPSRHPLAYLELCFLMHDVQCVLNRPDDALFHAKRARAALELSGPAMKTSQREQLDVFTVQALRAESVAYHNMRLFRQAHRAAREAELADADRHSPGGQLPHILRDRIAALIDSPRFTLSEVEGLADRAASLCERRAEDLDALWVFLIRRSQAQAYIAYGNLKRAGQLLACLRDQVATIPQIGPLHRVMFLKTDAHYWRDVGDLAQCGQIALQALAVGEEAGLTHQVAQLRQLCRLPNAVPASGRAPT